MDAVKREQIAGLKNRFDSVVLDVLGPIRLRKEINNNALHELKSIMEELRLALANEEYVPRPLVGELWFVFTSMLSEADHARNPEPILNEAWDIAERLRRIFGPTW